MQAGARGDWPVHRLAVRTRRGVLALSALGLAALTWRSHVVWRAEKADVGAQMEAFGLPRRQPELATSIAREPDPVRASLALGRALFAEATDRRLVARLPMAEAAREIAREGDKLRVARQRAAAVWARRPGCGEAAMILGGAMYLSRALATDAPAITETGWEAPLILARALAPADPEPMRLLAVAALEAWPLADASVRHRKAAILREAFEDPPTLTALAVPWLRIAGDAGTAFSAVPDVAWAWETMAAACARLRDWQGFCEAHERRHRALERELREGLAAARARLAGGDVVGARGLYRRLLAAVPPDAAFAPSVAAILEISPPGTVEPHTARAATGWLAWVLEGTVRGVERLPARAVARLVAAAGDLDAPTAALAALAAGDPTMAEVHERRSEALNLEAWAPYCLAKARWLAARGEGEGARAALGSVHRAFRDGPVYAQVALAVARATRDERLLREAEERLANCARHRWEATDWRWRGGVASLDLLLPESATALAVTVDQAPGEGAVVAFRLDGRLVLLRPVGSGTTVVIGGSLTAGLHLLQVEAVAGGRTAPGVVEVVGSAQRLAGAAALSPRVGSGG